MDIAGWPKEQELKLGVPKCELLETPNEGAFRGPNAQKSVTLESPGHNRGSLATLLMSYFFPNVCEVDEPRYMFCNRPYIAFVVVLKANVPADRKAH